MQTLKFDKMKPVGCLSEEEIALYVEGAGGEVLASRVFLHVDRCDECRELVASLARSPGGSEETGSGPRVGRFILRQVLGEGAMGIVYLAYDPQLKRHVAVKLLRPDTDHPGASERFIVEAQTAAQLAHPNAVTVYDAGSDKGQPYVAMEYVDGINGADWLKRGGVSWQAGVEVMLAAGEGLAAAHRAGLVHRDFKPGNILLAKDGRVKVTDFGLAQFNEKAELAIAAHEDALNLPRAQRHVTQAGMLVGTPAYTAPELMAGKQATAASDQYAFSVALYAAVYGRRPFLGKTPYELYRNVIENDPPPPSSDSAVPLAIWPVIARGLAKAPSARFASMDEYLAALRQASATEQSSSRIEPSERCPFPGLAAFAEEDAGLFFGRDRELSEFLSRAREAGAACVVGPSGAGKSSFVRALALPALRHADPTAEIIALRPGSDPFAALARLIAPLTTGDAQFQTGELADWLRRDPNRLAGVLLARARHYNSSIILYVDQLEELYALSTEREARIAFAECIAQVGADPTRPLRLVVSLRSDFLDHAGESAAMMGRITAGFLFLAPPRRESLIEAIRGPLEAIGYQLEDEQIANQLANELGGEPGAFPLLQFVARRLWDDRDRERRVITRASLESMGALAGALATHADTVLSQLTSSGLTLARAVLLRLVTPEGTKRAATMEELADLTRNPAELNRVVEILVKGRLLIAERQIETRSSTIELVHEMLIATWPTLRRWFADQAGDVALVADVGVAARRWQAAGYSEGLLWRGEQAKQIAALLDRSAELTSAEMAFSSAVVKLANRATRRRRVAFGLVLAVLAAIAAGASLGLLFVRQAEQRATQSAEAAAKEAERAKAAESRLGEQLEAKEAAERKRIEAQRGTEAANARVAEGQEQLAVANKELQKSVAKAEESTRLAEANRKLAEEATAEVRKQMRRTEDRLAEEKKAREAAEKKARQIIEKGLND